MRPGPKTFTSDPLRIVAGLLLIALGCGGCSRLAPSSAPTSRPRPAGLRRYDEPREARDFYARKRAPEGQRAIPTERYRLARERIAAMAVYSTREAGFVGGDRRTTGAAVASGPAVPNLGTWAQLGPGNVGGRTRAIVLHPTVPSTMYAAGVAGGVWKSTNAGTSWNAVGDVMENLAVSTLAMDPGDSNVLLAGTGEGYFNGDAVRGAGIFRTANGGTSWTQIDRPGSGPDKTCEFHYVNKIVWSAQHPDHAYAATGYSSGCDGSNTGGVYRTTSGGTSWTRILTSAAFGGCLDLAIREDLANDTLFASCGTFSPASLLRTTSARTASSNASWTDLTLTDGTLAPWRTIMGRTSLALAPSNPQTIYAAAADNSLDDFLVLFRSNDGGASFVVQATYADTPPANLLFTNTPFAYGCFGPAQSFNQGWYDNVIAVDPTDEDVVWVGGVDLFRWNPSASAFELVSFWWEDPPPPGGNNTFTHADQHAIVFHPAYDGISNTTVFFGNDGGVFRTDNATAASATDPCDPSTGGVTYTSLNNGYGVTQFYYGAVLPDDTQYFGGTQDNGTVRGADGSPNAWFELLGGDGGAVAVNPNNTSVLYAENFGLSIQKSTNAGASWFDAVSGISDNGFEFIAPFAMDPSAPIDAAAADRLWTGGFYVWRTTNGAASWQRASALLSSSVTAIGIAPANPSFVLAGTRNGAIHRNLSAQSAGSGTSWPSTKPRNGYVSSVTFDPWDPNVAYATYSTFGGVHVWKSTNAGASFSPLDGAGAGKLPDLPVHSLVVDPTNAMRLYVGTDLGVFVTVDGGLNWAAENTGFGKVVTEHLVLNGANLYAFTHGRGVWRVPLSTASQTALLELVDSASVVTEEAVGHDVLVRLRTSDHSALGSTVTVEYATVDGTAKAGSDYTTTTGTLTFPAGSTGDGDTLPISIPVLEDGVGEPSETLSLNLSSPSGAILARRLHTVRIDDDGDPPGISIGDITVTEGNTGTTNAVFTVTLSGPAPAPGVSVGYQTADGTATVNNDYLGRSGLLQFPTGSLTKTLLVPVIGDTAAEPARTFVVDLMNASANAILDDSQGVATLFDNDVAGTVAFASATYAVSEKGLLAKVALKRTGGFASGVSVTVATQDGSASSAASADFTATTTAVDFGTSGSATFIVPITNDVLDEPAETVLLRLVGSPTGFGATLGAQQTALLHINDDDAGGQLKFAAAAYGVNEGESVDLTVTRMGGVAGGVTVAYSVTGGTAASPADFSLGGTGTLTFGPGETQKTITVTATAAGGVEGNETLEVTLASPTGGATLGLATTTVTIVDADASFAFTAASYLVKESQKSLLVTVRRTGDLTAAATVDYLASDDTATQVGGSRDYEPAAATLTFAPGIPTQTFTVLLRPDADVESDEVLRLSLSNPTGGVGLGSPSANVPVTIQNDDVGGTLSLASAALTVLESKPLVLLTVKRTGGAANAQVSYSTTDGSAVSPDDFAGGGPTPLFIPAGRSSATFAVPVVQDLLPEGNHGFTVSLSSPSPGASLGSITATTVTILDDEPVVAFAAASYGVKEPASGTANLQVLVKRSGPTAPAVTVDYAVLGGDATNGQDYTLAGGTLNFPSGGVTQAITIPVSPDTLYEGKETILLALQAPAGAGLGALEQTTVSITDHEPVVFLSSSVYKASEPKGALPGQAVITVKRTGDLALPSTVAYSLTPGSAGSSDFDGSLASPPSPLGFLSGQASLQIKVPLLPDAEDEALESFTINLSAPTDATLQGPPSATVEISDNDVAGRVQLASAAWSVAEGAGAATLTLKRSGGTAGEASVLCSTDDGAPETSATAGSDYTSTAQLVTFSAGQTSANCIISITGDAMAGEGAETVRVILTSPSFGVTIAAPAAGLLYIADDE